MISQKSVGLHIRQHSFLEWCRGKTLETDEGQILFKADSYIRHALDNQIKKISEYYSEVKQFLPEDEK